MAIFSSPLQSLGLWKLRKELAKANRTVSELKNKADIAKDEYREQLFALKLKHTKEIAAIRASYEKELYAERSFLRDQTKQLTDKVLQAVGLTSVFPTMTSRDEIVTPLDHTVETVVDIDLSKEEKELFEERKADFWQEGTQLGKTEVEIVRQWEAMRNLVQDDVVTTLRPYSEEAN